MKEPVSRKNIIFSIVCIVLFIADWMGSNIPLLRFFEENGDVFHEKDLISNMVNASSGYQSYTKNGFIMVILFCYLYEYMRQNNQSVVLIRVGSRNNYCKYYIRKIMILTLLFSIIHALVDIFMIVIFRYEYLLDIHYIQAEIFQLVAGTLFLIQNAIIYEVFRLETGKSVALLFMTILIIVEYFMFYLKGAKFLPVSDSVVMEELMDGTSITCYMLYISRSSIFALMNCIIYRNCFNRRDLIRFE